MATSLRQASPPVGETHPLRRPGTDRQSFGFDNWNTWPKLDEPTEARGAGGKVTLTARSAAVAVRVTKLIAGPDSFICDACVGLCVSIIARPDITS